MSIRGSFVISDLNNRYVKNVDSQLKMNVNYIKQLKKNKNQEMMERIKNSKGKEFKDIRLDFSKEYSSSPSLSLKYFLIDQMESNIDTFNSLIDLEKVKSPPNVYGFLSILDGHIKPSKNYIFQIFKNISYNFSCTIYLELEKGKGEDINEYYEIYFKNGEVYQEVKEDKPYLLHDTFVDKNSVINHYIWGD